MSGAAASKPHAHPWLRTPLQVGAELCSRGAGAQDPSHLPSLSPQYRRAMTLEAFAVTVAQLLGLSLGMELEDPGSCQCAGAACIMQPNSV